MGDNRANNLFAQIWPSVVFASYGLIVIHDAQIRCVGCVLRHSLAIDSFIAPFNRSFVHSLTHSLTHSLGLRG